MSALIRNMLKNMTLTVGQGNNRFTMNRGSFRCRKGIRWARNIRRTGITET